MKVHLPFGFDAKGTQVISESTAGVMRQMLRTVSYSGTGSGNRVPGVDNFCKTGTTSDEKDRWYVKVPVFSFNKLRGLDAYLSPEMKSTGEAIGYDDKLNRALYKALQASGMKLQNYGTVFVTLADKDKRRALSLVRRFYNLGFNIEATAGTAAFLKRNGIKTRTMAKISEGGQNIIDSLTKGHVTYVINTIDVNQHNTRLDGYEIRNAAVENNVSLITALETVSALLDVLEEITLGVSTIDAEYNAK